MDLRQLEYIVQIAEENNITRAAEKLYITQSSPESTASEARKKNLVSRFFTVHALTGTQQKQEKSI